jgi:hypothetical protein
MQQIRRERQQQVLQAALLRLQRMLAKLLLSALLLLQMMHLRPLRTLQTALRVCGRQQRRRSPPHSAQHTMLHSMQATLSQTQLLMPRPRLVQLPMTFQPRQVRLLPAAAPGLGPQLILLLTQQLRLVRLARSVWLVLLRLAVMLLLVLVMPARSVLVVCWAR